MRLGNLNTQNLNQQIHNFALKSELFLLLFLHPLQHIEKVSLSATSGLRLLEFPKKIKNLEFNFTS